MDGRFCLGRMESREHTVIKHISSTIYVCLYFQFLYFYRKRRTWHASTATNYYVPEYGRCLGMFKFSNHMPFNSAYWVILLALFFLSSFDF